MESQFKCHLFRDLLEVTASVGFPLWRLHILVLSVDWLVGFFVASLPRKTVSTEKLSDLSKATQLD